MILKMLNAEIAIELSATKHYQLENCTKETKK